MENEAKSHGSSVSEVTPDNTNAWGNVPGSWNYEVSYDYWAIEPTDEGTWATTEKVLSLKQTWEIDNATATEEAINFS